MTGLVGPVELAGRTAPSRIVFGPHETNLGTARSFSNRHVAYYAARAAGGCGVIVTETASVHPSDWPYERAPLASASGPGWRDVVEACRPFGTLVLAGLGHAGGQGSSAYSQSVLWAPSPVADVVSREMPMTMGTSEIDALVVGFASAGRAAIGPDRIISLRLSCDELAPWAGVTPEHAAEQVGALADRLDLLVVVRGGPYSSTAYRPDAHTPAGVNIELCAAMRRAAAGRVPVVLQGSVVEVTMAETALADGTADLVEMTRAQIADPGLVAKLRDGRAGEVRPCILCNQACRVRDNRNPLVSCVGEPRSGHETVDTDPGAPSPVDARSGHALVVGAGIAGLECARVLASRGHRVRIQERKRQTGGALRSASVGPGRQRLAGLADWLETECTRLGVTIETGVETTAADLDAARRAGSAVVLATGGRPAPWSVPSDGSVAVVDAASALARDPDALDPGPVVVLDTVGGPIGVGVAEWLAAAGRHVSFVTADQIAGTLLSLTGDLADANTRLQQAGVSRELRARVHRIDGGQVHLEDPLTGATREVTASVLIDCGHRLPDEDLYLERPGTLRAGDCVAPRTVLDSVLEGRRRALEICGFRPTARTPITTGATA